MTENSLHTMHDAWFQSQDPGIFAHNRQEYIQKFLDAQLISDDLLRL